MLFTQTNLAKTLAASLALCVSPVLLADNAHLSAHIQGARHDNTWFLCMPHESGCFSLQAATKGKLFPLTPGKIQQAFILNAKHLRISAQTLPESCHVTVHDNQTLRISGKLQNDRAGRAHIDGLSCRLSG